MTDIEDAARLLSEACTTLQASISSLNVLERDVETAAGACWDVRERSVQVKAGFMRSKTLIIEEPVFNHDAEHAFGDVLRRWEDSGAGAVASAAVEAKAAEERLLHAASAALKGPPAAQLAALSTLVTLAGALDAAALEDALPSAQALVRELTLQLGEAYLSAAPEGAEKQAELAAVLVRCGGGAWAAGLLQPRPEDVLAVLKACNVQNDVIAPDPSGVLCVLRQCDLGAVPSADRPALPRALADLMPAGAADASVAAKTCSALHAAILSTEQAATDSASAAADALLTMLLAASKGVTTASVRSDLKSDALNGTLDSVSIPDLAAWIFSTPGGAVQREVVRQQLAAVPWTWLASSCPSELRLRWIVAAVAAVKALAQVGGPEDAGTVRATVDALAGAPGWALASQGVLQSQKNAEEGHMLCMLEAPAGEQAAVQLLWRQVQTTVALALCSRSAVSDTLDAVSNASNLLETARAGETLAQMVENGRGAAAAAIAGHAINSVAGGAGFDAIQPVVSVALGAALSAPEGEQSGALAALATATARAVHASDSTSTADNIAEDLLQLNLDASATEERQPADGYDGFAAVVAWLGLLVGELGQGGGALSEPAMSLTSHLVRAVYSLLGASGEAASGRLAHLALSLASATRGLPQQRLQMLVANLLGSSEPWMRVLGAWVADGAALAPAMPQQSTGPWSLADAISALSAFNTASTDADTAAEEAFQLQEAAVGATAAPVAAAVLWFELFARVARHRDTLQPLLSREELIIGLGTAGHALYARSPALATAITSLVKLLEAPPAEEQTLLPFIGSYEAAKEAAGVDAAWRQDWPAAPAVADAAAPPAAALPPRIPPPDPANLDYLKHREEQQEKALAQARLELRYWVRQSEKAAAPEEGVEPFPVAGREGDVPQPLADSQRLLWEVSNRWREELAGLHAALRQRIIQQYNPVDEQFLQETSDAFSDGQRIPRTAAYRDPQHAAKCRELRSGAREVAVGATAAKEVGLAAAELFKFEHILLEATEEGEMPQERAKIRSQLLTVAAASLVDGATPPPGAPFLVGLFERAVGPGGVVLDTDAKLRLIPRIAAALGTSASVVATTPGAPAPVALREEEGVRLLKACLDPDALLNAGRLREFLGAMAMVERYCRGVGGAQAGAMLASFDAHRFAVLVVENPRAVSAASGGGSGSSSSSRSKNVSVEEVLGMAAHCLAHPASAATGAALLEGALSMAPAPLYAAVLGVVLQAPASGRRDSLLGMLGRVPMGMVAPAVVAAALTALCEALRSGALDPPDLPHELLSGLIRSEPVLEALKYGVEAQSAGKKGKKDAPALVTTQLREKAWQLSSMAATTGRIADLDEGGSSGAGGSGSGSSQSTPAGPAALGANGTDASPPPSVSLGPVSSTHLPLGQLAEDTLGAAMDAVLRVLRGGGGSGDSAGADNAQQLLSLVFDLAGQGPWSLGWAWAFYRSRLNGFLEASGGTAGGGAVSAAFAQYWASLPWAEATFHLRSPAEIASIRAFLPAADGAAAELIHALDWRPVAAAALPPAAAAPAAAPVASSTAAPGVFTLLDEDEEVAAMISTPTAAAGATGSPLAVVGSGPRSLWAAELGLLLLHCAVYLAESSTGLPEWARAQLLDHEGPGGQVEAVAVLAGADWRRVEAVLLDPSLPAPWLVLPLLLCPQMVRGDVGQRLVHAALVLSRAAEREGSAAAAAAAAKAVRPLLALSVCQGVQLEAGGAQSGQAAAAAAAAETSAALAASLASHQLVDIPSDIPEELLEGTVELEQLRLQREQIRIAQEEAEAAAAAAAAAAATQGPQAAGAAPLVEVTRCFRLTPAQHVALIHEVLGPLAAAHAPADLSAIRPEHCGPNLERHGAPGDVNNGEDDDGGVKVWYSPPIASLATEPTTTNSGGGGAEAVAAAAAATCIAMLQPLVQRPITILTQDPLPFGNADLPWFKETSAAVFLSAAGGGGEATAGLDGASTDPAQRVGRSVRAVRKQIASLLRRRDRESADDGDGDGDPAAADAALNRAVTDAVALRNLMAQAVEDAGVRATYSSDKRLGACLLRCVLLSPSVHSSATVSHFAESVLRALASPPGRETPGAAVAAFMGPTPTAHAAEEVPVIAAGGEGVTVTQMDAVDMAGVALDAAEPEGAAPESIRLAAAAAAGRTPEELLRFARAAVTMRCPLMAAFALSAARHAAQMADKTAWQVLAVGALEVAAAAESNGEHPLEVVAPWLEAMRWLGDTRWRRLPPGPHRSALLEFLSALDGRAQVIEFLTPEELIDPSDPRMRRNPVAAAVSKAAERLRQMRAASAPADAAEAGEGGGTALPAYHAVGQLSTHQPLPPPGVPESISEVEPAVAVAELGPQEDPGQSVKRKLASGLRMFSRSVSQAGRSVTQAGNKLRSKLGDSESPDTASTSTSQSTAATTAVAPAAPGLSARQIAAIEPTRDLLVRVGLAAFAVASYVRSVMDTRLTRRTVSGAEPPAAPGSPGGRLYSGPSHTRGNSAMTGSRQIEEAQLSELDTVLEAREAVDHLHRLEAAPLLAPARGLYAGFLERLPALLTAETPAATFAAAVPRLLLPREAAEPVVGVLAHEGV